MMKANKIFKVYSGLPRSIYILFVVRVINALGAFVGPFITIFLSGKLGFNNETIGFFIMANWICMVPGSLLGGKICDTIGRKKILIVFQFLSGLCYIPCAFLGISILVPYFLILSSFFNSVAQPAYGAMVADLTHKKNRKNAYSLLYLGVNLGFSIGPMIAGFLYNHYLKMLFLGNSIAVFISVIIILLFIQETNPGKVMECTIINENERAEKGSLISVLIKRPLLLSFSILSMMYTFVYALYPFCIPLQVNEIFKDAGPVVYGKIIAANAITVTLFTTILISITRKLTPIKNVALAGLFYAVGFGMMYFITSFGMFILATIIWTIGEIIHTTNSGVYIANHTPMSHRGRFNAVIPLISDVGFALGPAIIGMYIKGKRVIDAWPVAFLIATVTAGLFYSLSILEKKKAVSLDSKVL